MTQIAARQTKNNPKFLLFHGMFPLVRCDPEMLRRPCSPLLVMLQSVDPNVLDRPPQTVQRKGSTLLHYLAKSAGHSIYSTHQNQIILGRQLSNTASTQMVYRFRTIIRPCTMHAVIIRRPTLTFLVAPEKGADTNTQMLEGASLLAMTQGFSPGAAKLLLEWGTTDDGSFLPAVRGTVVYFLTMRSLITQRGQYNTPCSASGLNSKKC
jgi:hypothetical protein